MVISIILTLCVSGIFSLIGYLFDKNPAQWFTVSLVLQFILFFIINFLTKTVVQMRLNKLEIQRLNHIDENRVRIDCSVCKDPNDIVIKIGRENEFRCEKCKSLNKVTIAISNFQKTEIFDGLITEDVIESMKNKKDLN